MDITYETLKDRTKKRIIEEMIRAVRPSNKWKVVVVDSSTLRIISAACRMFDITEEDVSLVENIAQERQPLPNMEAIYFLAPTTESIDYLLADFKDSKKPRYGTIHLFFTKRVPDEELKRIKSSNVLAKVKTFKEMNMDFVAFEQQVFHFDSPESFKILFNPDGQKGGEFKSIAEKLTSVCATLGDYPTIRYSINKESGSISQTVASVLQERLDDLMRSSPDYQNKANLGANRATLLLLDRSFDPVSPLLHEFTYQAMIYDLLKVENDHYKFQSTTNSGTSKEKEVILGETDPLWSVLRHMHIAETMNWLLDNFNTFMKENKAASITNGKKVQNLKDMADAMKSMPQFQEMLGKYSLHINMATAAMDEFNRKNLSKIAGTEQDMATGEDPEGKAVKNVMSNVAPILSDPNVLAEDKLRLMMLYIISQEGIKDSDRKRIMDLAKISFEDQSCISNLRYLGVTLMKTTKGQKKKQNKEKKKKNREDAPSYDLSRYVPAVKDLAEGLIENTLSVSEFPYVKEPVSMDDVKSKAAPTSMRKTKVTNIERKSEKVAVTGGRVIVFICGGMTHSEMRCAYELTKKYNREVIIGSTSILTPAQFISGLRSLKKADKADVDDD